VHFWHWIELLATLNAVDYRGWLGGDIMPKAFGPGDAYGSNVKMVEMMWSLVENFGIERLAALQGTPNALPTLFESWTQQLGGAATRLAPTKEPA